MKQMKLFNIDDQSNTEKKAFEAKNNNLFRKKTKKNKRPVVQEKSLIDEMVVEVKKVPLLVCKQPKTIKLIPCDWTKEQKETYVASHFDDKGRFNFEPAPDFTILSGQQNRR